MIFPPNYLSRSDESLFYRAIELPVCPPPCRPPRACGWCLWSAVARHSHEQSGNQRSCLFFLFLRFSDRRWAKNKRGITPPSSRVVSVSPLSTNKLQRRYLFLYTQIRRVEQAMLRRIVCTCVHRIAVPRGVENVTSKRVERRAADDGRPLVAKTVLNHMQGTKKNERTCKDIRYQGRENPQEIFMSSTRPTGLPLND